MNRKLTYKDSGVDINKKDKFVDNILRKIVKFSKGKIVNIPWGFAGFYKYDKNLLICGACDSVGTKVRIAALMNKFDTLGEDVVAMNVNDLVVHNIKPIFFLDYIASENLEKVKGQILLDGILKGCEKADIVLLGGETAIMPGFYTKNSFELVGCAVGIAKRSEIIYGKNMQVGDVIIGLNSNGIHSNGFSLVRKTFFKNVESKSILTETKLSDKTLGELLLTPTKIYVRTFLKLTTKFKPNLVIRGAAHITGGGIEGNLCRIIPDGLCAVINCRSWLKQEIFDFIQKKGNIPTKEMYNVFNMGIGFIFVINRNYLSEIKSFLENETNDSFNIIGIIEKGQQYGSTCKKKVKLIH